MIDKQNARSMPCVFVCLFALFRVGIQDFQHACLKRGRYSAHVVNGYPDGFLTHGVSLSVPEALFFSVPPL